MSGFEEESRIIDEYIDDLIRKYEILGLSDLRPWNDFFDNLALPDNDKEKIYGRLRVNLHYYRRNYLYLAAFFMIAICVFSPRLLVSVLLILSMIFIVYYDIIPLTSIFNRQLSRVEKIIFTASVCFFLAYIFRTLLYLCYYILIMIIIICAHAIFRKRSIKSKTFYELENIKLKTFQNTPDDDDSNATIGLFSDPTKKTGLRKRRD